MLEIIGSNPIGGSQIPPNNSAAFLLSMEADNLQLNAGVLKNFGQGLHAMNGNDTVKGSEDNEVMNGNRDDDLLMGGPGQDFLRGGRGIDQIHGDEGEDIVFGDRQDDFVYGGEGDDLVRGGKDSDFLEGGPGNDQILGDKGADYLIGGPGLDILTGGNDPNGSGDGVADIFQLATGEGTDIITDFEPGIDFIELPRGVLINNIQVRTVEQNSVITITATKEELAILNNVTPNSSFYSSLVDSGISVKPGIDKIRNDSNDKPSEIIKENPVNLLKEWQGRVYKFDGNTDSPSPVDINENLDKNKDFELVGIVNLGSNIRENFDGRYGINNANWEEGSVKGNSKLPEDNFLVKAYTEVYLEGGKTYEFEARGDDKYQIWLKNLDTEEWSWVTTKDEWKSTVGMEKDTTIKNSYTIPSNKGGRYYVGFFHYENDQEAYFGLNWKEKDIDDKPDVPSEIIKENPVNLLKEWQGRVYKFDGNTDSPSPVDINENLDKNKDFELVGIVNLGSNIRENFDGRYGINNANWEEGSVKGNSKLPEDNFLVKAYTEVYLEGGKTYEFEARGDDKYQIWLKNLDTEEWSWVTTKDEWKSTVGMEKDTTIKNSYTIPSNKGGRYYVGFFHYENDQEAYFGLNWKEKGTKYSYYDELAGWPDGPTTEKENKENKVKETWNWVAADNTRITGSIWKGEKNDMNYEHYDAIKQIYTDLSTAILGDDYKCSAGYVNDISYKQDPNAGKRYGWHDGIDLDTDNNKSTNVKALIGGKIRKKDDSGKNRTVVIEGDDGRFYHYLHLHNTSENLSVEDKIDKGATIGVVGPYPSDHLHFRVTNTLNRPNGYNKNIQKDVYEWTHNPLKVFWQLKREGLI